MRFAKYILVVLLTMAMPMILSLGSIAPCVSGNDTLSEPTEIHAEKISFRFRHDDCELDLTYAENAFSYARLRALIASGNILDINVRGAASPVGCEAYNNQLALRRADAARRLIDSIVGSGTLSVSVESAGEDWETFIGEVEANYHRYNRDAVLEILHADIPNAEKKRRLNSLDSDQTTWRYLVRRYMAASRSANSVTIRSVGAGSKVTESSVQDNPLAEQPQPEQRLSSQSVEQRRNPAEQAVTENSQPTQMAEQTVEATISKPKDTKSPAEISIIEQTVTAPGATVPEVKAKSAPAVPTATDTPISESKESEITATAPTSYAPTAGVAMPIVSSATPVTATATAVGTNVLVVPGEQTTIDLTYTLDGVEITHPTITLDGNWVMGKKYVYTINFGVNEIKFVPHVEDTWTPSVLVNGGTI